ncbi:unnamed protein product [Polarella glacialis]|uniref:Uncharacterized protein n=1 Tax=Polarella glacialis TaxID=89957 RepID=A0A813LUS1_POLGL|nr:unnamed protein product [Polarella glacialis]
MYGWTALDFALGAGQVEPARLLVLNGATAAAPETAAECAAFIVEATLMGNQDRLLQELAPFVGAGNSTAVDCHVAPGGAKSQGWWLLHVAVAASEFTNPQSVGKSIVEVLLQRGANATCVDNLGETPLFVAARLGRSDIVQVLLDASPGAAGIQDEKGRTALHYAITAGTKSCISVLIAGGASVRTVDEEGFSALQHAERANNNELVELILFGERTAANAAAGGSAEPIFFSSAAWSGDDSDGGFAGESSLRLNTTALAVGLVGAAGLCICSATLLYCWVRRDARSQQLSLGGRRYKTAVVAALPTAPEALEDWSAAGFKSSGTSRKSSGKTHGHKTRSLTNEPAFPPGRVTGGGSGSDTAGSPSFCDP